MSGRENSSGRQEPGGVYLAGAAIRGAAHGHYVEARQSAVAAPKISLAGPGVAVGVALALAMAGDTTKVESSDQRLGHTLSTCYPGAIVWLPAYRCSIGANRKNPAEASQQVQRALPPIEFGAVPFVFTTSWLYPTYVRGEAYSAAAEGKEAAVEFQKILDHNGMVWNYWTGALARLDFARAFPSTSGTREATVAKVSRHSCCCKLSSKSVL